MFAYIDYSEPRYYHEAYGQGGERIRLLTSAATKTVRAGA
jgi:hypothetical protein